MDLVVTFTIKPQNLQDKKVLTPWKSGLPYDSGTPQDPEKVTSLLAKRYLDRFCHFCTAFRPFNRCNISSAIFAHVGGHSIGLYSMCGWVLYRHHLEWRHTSLPSISIGSAVFAQLTIAPILITITTSQWFMSVYMTYGLVDIHSLINVWCMNHRLVVTVTLHRPLRSPVHGSGWWTFESMVQAV